jgi:hypothetical protein
MFDRHCNLRLTQKKLALALIFSLLLAQWLVFTHVHNQDNGATDTLCSICVSGEHFNHASVNKHVSINIQAGLLSALIQPAYTFSQQPVLAFNSRAPPVLL